VSALRASCSVPFGSLGLVLTLGAMLIAIGGCGGSQPDRVGDSAAHARPARADGAPTGAQATLRAFARAVLSARTGRMCPLLRGQARHVQGCGTEGEDFGPMLRLTIRSVRDVRLVSAAGVEARAVFPRLGRDARRRPVASWCRPQRMRLQRRSTRWFIVELTFGSDYEPSTAGCRGLAAAAADADLALPAFNAVHGACPTVDPAPLGRDPLEQARRAALRQAPVLYPVTDLTGMHATRVARAVDDDAGRGGYARVKCGTALQRRAVVVWLSFPAQRPSASLSQGVVLVSRFGAAYRVWAVLH
jgi:hypothetical protein